MYRRDSQQIGYREYGSGALFKPAEIVHGIQSAGVLIAVTVYQFLAVGNSRRLQRLTVAVLAGCGGYRFRSSADKADIPVTFGDEGIDRIYGGNFVIDRNGKHIRARYAVTAEGYIVIHGKPVEGLSVK